MDENYIENNQQENEKEFLKEQRKKAFLNWFKNIKKLDAIIVLAVFLIAVFALFSFLGVRKLGKTPVQKEQKVAIQVFFKNLIISDNHIPFKIGDKAFITIRNVPYTSLNIIDASYDEKKTVIPSSRNKKGYIVVPDVTLPLQFDFLITLEDNVKVTDEGEYVVGGNKLKTGLPIILEGTDYRFNGVISSIREIGQNESEENENEEESDD